MIIKLVSFLNKSYVINEFEKGEIPSIVAHVLYLQEPNLGQNM